MRSDRLPSGPPLVFLILGQSNAEGRGTTVYTPDVINASFYGHDGQFHSLIDPVSVGAVFSVYGMTGSGYSLVPTFARRLRELLVTNPLVFVPSAYAGTDSASWALGISDAPPDPNKLIGRTKTRLSEAAAFYTDAKLGGIITYQGESDSQTEVESLAHAANWAAVYDELETYGAGILPWLKAKHVWHCIMPATAPSGYTYWDNVRTQAASLSSRPALVNIQAPETSPAGLLHHNTGTSDAGGLRKLGVDLADSWFAAA